MKSGLRLKELKEFPPEIVVTLQKLGIVTLEEFIDLEFREPQCLAEFLNLLQEELHDLAEKLADYLSPQVLEELRTPVEEEFGLGALNPKDYPQ